MIQEGSRNSMSRHSPQPSNTVKDTHSAVIVSYTLYNSKNNGGDRIKVVNEGGQGQTRENHEKNVKAPHFIEKIRPHRYKLYIHIPKFRVRNAPKLESV